MRYSLLAALRMWLFANLFMSALFFAAVAWQGTEPLFSLLAFPAGLIGSLPVAFLLFVEGLWLQARPMHPARKRSIYKLSSILFSLPYAMVSAVIGINDGPGDDTVFFVLAGSIVAGAALAVLVSQDTIARLCHGEKLRIKLFNTTTMETSTHLPEQTPEHQSSSSSHLMKGLITAGLILVMLIPMIFVSNLVSERKARQKEVTGEVSAKWSGAQTLSGPFIYVPYTYKEKDSKGKEESFESHFYLLPSELKVDGILDHELRSRSIYKVLLYKAKISESGKFRFELPKDLSAGQVKWNDIRLCMSLSDFKGLESEVKVRTAAGDLELAPGMPENDSMSKGLSAPAGLTEADLGKELSFSTSLSLKGSERLHFIPLGNSSFNLRSKWPSPSFDGNNLPTSRVSDSGFTANWAFNKANLPFGTILRGSKTDLDALSFGVTLVQPGDQYAKTERTVKYAILVIGLTFSLFFITELTQKKPVHPMQYVLIGLALVIFYTLLLSISEFVWFDAAYAIAAIATIALIGAYVRSHFSNWKAPAMISSTLTLLYVFIFVLVSLEDTALLVGSIGLFFILAITMYVSRKINWAGNSEVVAEKEG